MIATASPISPIGATSDGASDRQLLALFVRQQDEAAFAELVRRHSRTVWNVCRRLLLREQDAEDAFQAVFTVLARNAATIRKGEAVGSWLYGVALRIARRARQQAFQRRRRESQARVPASEPPAWSDAACRELQRYLDEEVQRLPGKYRAPFVLCCLEGMSKAEAARELGWKEGTVSGRLAQARKLLKRRLARRGVLLSAVLTASVLVQQSAAGAAPAVLVQATVHGLLAQTGAGTAASLSPQALSLASAFLHATTASKAAAIASVILAATALVGGLSLAAFQDEPSPKQPRRWAAAKQPGGGIALVTQEPVYALAFSPDGSRLVVGGGMRAGMGGVGQPGSCVACHSGAPAGGGKGGVMVVQPPAAPGGEARITPLPPTQGQINLWAMDVGKLMRADRSMPAVRALVFAPDGQTLATGAFNGEIRVMDAQTGAVQAKVQAHEGGANGVAFSPDGTLLASGGQDHTVKFWDAKSLNPLKVLRGHTGSVLAVAFFHHGRSIASASQDKTAKIWDVLSGEGTLTLHGHQDGIAAVAVSPDEKTVATASADKALRLWAADTGKPLAVLSDSPVALHSVAFSPDGKVLAGGAGDGRIFLWDTQARKRAGTLERHRGIVWALAFSPRSSRLASGSADSTVKLWDVAARRELTTLRGPGSTPGMASTPGAVPADQDAAFGQCLRPRLGAAPPSSGIALDGEDESKAGSRLWLLLVLLVALAASYLVFWIYVRRKRRKAQDAGTNGQAATPTAVPLAAPLLFTCATCGKRLRVPAELAGKNIKCSQCGQAIPAPLKPMDVAIRPA